MDFAPQTDSLDGNSCAAVWTPKTADGPPGGQEGVQRRTIGGTPLVSATGAAGRPTEWFCGSPPETHPCWSLELGLREQEIGGTGPHCPGSNHQAIG